MSSENRPRHGFVFGKFLPFHNGHKRLIERVISRCEAVTVAVFSRDAEPIPGHIRAHWIRQECPEARVIHVVTNYPNPWDEESWEFWAETCRRCASSATHLFTAEDYGDELARRMGIEHELVDRNPIAAAVSGAAIRQDPIAHWQHVPAAVRPWLVRKVAIVGAESTGKTTLAEQLTEHYETVWAPEYGREYCELKEISTLTPNDLLAIAIEQAEIEDRMAVQSNGLLICDTDLMVTRAWCAHLCGTVHPGIAGVERSRRYDLHLVTNLAVAWQNDGTRVCESDDVRKRFHNCYIEELSDRSACHIQLPPRQGDAFALACDIIETLWPVLKRNRS
jgi:HTH-type transcriptional repressor of NAD biosynthesis genes